MESHGQLSNLTRRSFIKKSAFTVAAVATLSKGVALGNSPTGPCPGSCNGFLPHALTPGTYGKHKIPGTAIWEYWTTGTCYCDSCTTKFDAVEILSSPQSGIAYPILPTPFALLNHTATRHNLPSHNR